MSATTTATTTVQTTLIAKASTVPSAQAPKRQDKQEDVDVYDEIEIEDMTYDSALQIYHYPCPCGDRFEINIDSLRDGEEIADYGRRKDKAEMILRQTEAALKDLRAWIEQQGFEGRVQVFSNKMNAGFFDVEWAATLNVIKKVFGNTDVKWTVVVVDDKQPHSIRVPDPKESKLELR
ncbi:hypothetical protein DV736_g1766, partial [Chaetothyriales sp. CBS 134916]